MKITLDHNVIINIVNRLPNVQDLCHGIKEGKYLPHVVEVGASEMRQMGIRPERYDQFEQLLADAGLERFPRLAPVGIWDVTFFGHCLFGDDVTTQELDEIERILFGGSRSIKRKPEEASKDYSVWLNRMCDVLTLWCHLESENEVFVTSDRNFIKATKLPKLMGLGVGKVCLPEELMS